MHTLPLIESEFTRLPARFFSRVAPTTLGEPYWVAQNHALAAELNLSVEIFNEPDNLLYLTGSAKNITLLR